MGHASLTNKDYILVIQSYVMALQAFWVNGTAVKQEREGYFISKQYYGHGVKFNSRGEEWFHFSIPTPVILNNVRSSIKKIFVFYATEGSAVIRHVRYYDGPKIIQSFDNINKSGNHSNTVDADNGWLVTLHPMLFGVGISVCVNFGTPSPSNAPAVWFTAVGADFDA
jgi:hypothetical protein